MSTTENTTVASLVVFEQNETLLSVKANEYRGLRVAGLEDKAGLAKVRAARLELKRYRVSIENDRKRLKADALEFGRKVDAEAKRLTAIIEPTESDLQAEEDRIEAEVAAIAKAKLDKRMAQLAEAHSTLPPSVVEAMGDHEFAEVLDQAIVAYENVLVAKVKEEKRLEAERAEADRKAAEERAKLEEERKALAAQREADAKARREAEEKARAEQAERDRLALEERKRIAAEQKKLDEERAALAAERAAIEAAKPAAQPEPDSFGSIAIGYGRDSTEDGPVRDEPENAGHLREDGAIVDPVVNVIEAARHLCRIYFGTAKLAVVDESPLGQAINALDDAIEALDGAE